MQASFHQGDHHHGDLVDGEGEGGEDDEVFQHERGERDVPRREESSVGGGK